MFAAGRRGDAGGVEVRIRFEQTDPPVGQLWSLTVPGDPSHDAVVPTGFTGWLNLLRALSDALGDEEDAQRQSWTG